MNILVVLPYVPNPIRVRPYQFVRHLHTRGHTVTVAALWGSAEERRELEALADMGIRTLGAEHTRARALGNCLRALPGRTPLQAAYSHSPALEELLRRALADDRTGTLPDAIHVEHLRGSPFLLALRQTLSGPGRARPRLVWDSVDCISLLFDQAARQSTSRRARLMARMELGRTRRHEARLVHAADHTLVTAVGDAEALRALAFAADPIRDPCLSVVSNGVDTETFSPGPTARAPARIVFSGKMSYHANETAALYLARTVMPSVWVARPDAELWIVGKQPGPALAALANPQAATRRVVVTGEVPSMAGMLQQATVAAAPVVYGAGVQNKVLEAMACATPVVASSRAVSALDAQHGRDLLVACTPDEFARQILALLETPNLRDQLGAAGRAYVERCHSWDASAARLEAIYIGETPSGPPAD